ncbi:hypothetical protein BTTAP_30030 [Brochothrix thermosphacta]|nr:hypothetical protein BTTAP_30030 [Brochothrix thermosphacta]
MILKKMELSTLKELSINKRIVSQLFIFNDTTIVYQNKVQKKNRTYHIGKFDFFF